MTAPQLTIPSDPHASVPFGPLFVLFRPIPGFPGYGADTDGNVWSCHSRGYRQAPTGPWFRMSPAMKPDYGHRHVNLVSNGRKHHTRIGRLVLTTFIGPCPPGRECCHDNGDASDNRLSNLRWDTPSNNQLDRHRHGTANAGSRHGLARLTEPEVAEIRRRYAAGEKQSTLAGAFGVAQTSISRIVRKAGWSHV